MSSNDNQHETSVAGVAQSSSPTGSVNYGSIEHIDESLRIKILYQDSSIVVIAKPGHLRSVPGHAANNEFDPTQPTGPRKRPREENDDSKLSGQRAWIAAIQSFEKADSSSAERDWTDECIARLAGNSTLVASVPRKWKVFCRYILRNKQRLMQSSDECSEDLAKDMYARIQQRYRSYLPEPTKPEQSALGQLSLLGLRRTDQDQESGQPGELYTVHRLDCETSGVMVFARTQVAASTLAKSWRQRETVNKSYLAHVQHWPPFHEDGQISGSIDIHLKPSEERIKWRACLQSDEGARASKTLWRVCADLPKEGPLILELTPVTGRTHQLRIHCAEVGSGITGDSLYSGVLCGSGHVDPDMVGDACSIKALCLHAHKLSFPHPETKKLVEFVAKPPGWSEVE
jgi:tRNA pseudouridine32 synthase/23S rRNA pseudouridine746 synthase